MAITATSAPSRPRHNRFEISDVSFSSTAMVVTVDIADEGGAAVIKQELNHLGARWQSLTYTASGDLQVTTTVAPAGSLGADFAAFAGTAGNFATRAAALETHMLNTGRLPA